MSFERSYFKTGYNGPKKTRNDVQQQECLENNERSHLRVNTATVLPNLLKLQRGKSAPQVVAEAFCEAPEGRIRSQDARGA